MNIRLLLLLLLSNLGILAKEALDFSTASNRPKVGVAVLLIKDGKLLLLHKRKGSLGASTWAPPGGHLEFGESFADCGRREVLEEAGIQVIDLQLCGVTNDIYPSEHKHYVSVFMQSTNFIGEATVLEPDKCECWQWFALDELPENLFLALKNFLETNTLIVPLI